MKSNQRKKVLLAVLLLSAIFVSGAFFHTSSVQALSGDRAGIERMVKSGNAQIQYELGTMLYDKGEYSSAAVWLEVSADKGHSGAQSLYGAQLCEGKGVYKNALKGLDLVKKAATQGDAAAVSYLEKVRMMGLSDR